MGGKGSGGHNRLSDDEKRRRGTFRKDTSEAVYAEADAAKVVAGPWLTTIPEPDLPLNEHGRRKYDELTKVLFDANKLTAVTRSAAEQVAVLFQEQHARMTAGKPVPASLSTQMQRALAMLRIAEDAPVIDNPEGKRNKFSGCGFASRIPAAR